MTSPSFRKAGLEDSSGAGVQDIPLLSQVSEEMQEKS